MASPPWDGNHARVTNGRRAIGLDIGGTKVAGAIVGEDGTVHAELRRNTPDTSDADTMTTLLREMVEELRGVYAMLDHPNEQKLCDLQQRGAIVRDAVRVDSMYFRS